MGAIPSPLFMSAPKPPPLVRCVESAAVLGRFGACLICHDARSALYEIGTARLVQDMTLIVLCAECATHADHAELRFYARRYRNGRDVG